MNAIRSAIRFNWNQQRERKKNRAFCFPCQLCHNIPCFVHFLSYIKVIKVNFSICCFFFRSCVGLTSTPKISNAVANNIGCHSTAFCNMVFWRIYFTLQFNELPVKLVHNLIIYDNSFARLTFYSVDDEASFESSFKNTKYTFRWRWIIFVLFLFSSHWIDCLMDGLDFQIPPQ